MYRHYKWGHSSWTESKRNSPIDLMRLRASQSNWSWDQQGCEPPLRINGRWSRPCFALWALVFHLQSGGARMRVSASEIPCERKKRALSPAHSAEDKGWLKYTQQSSSAEGDQFISSFFRLACNRVEVRNQSQVHGHAVCTLPHLKFYRCLCSTGKRCGNIHVPLW